MDTLLTILRPICQRGMNLSLKKCLISILQAMIVSWSVNILKLASEFASSAGVASVVRRTERFLLRGLVKQHEAARSIIKSTAVSVQQWLVDKYGSDRKIMMAHRLDQDTSGLLIATFGKLPYKIMQSLFATRCVKKDIYCRPGWKL